MNSTEISKIHRANLFFVYLKKQTEEYLEENNISKCEKCKGVGLANVKIHQSESMTFSSWDGTSYCDYCNGIGFKGIQEKGLQIDLLHYICRNCGGLGCKNCNEGVVDWIDHSMGR